MKLVIIESPLSARSRQAIEENKRYAKECFRDSLMRGEAPFRISPFLRSAWTLNDLIPQERDLGMQAGFAWGSKAELVAIYTDKGISPGMKMGIKIAEGERLTDSLSSALRETNGSGDDT